MSSIAVGGTAGAASERGALCIAPHVAGRKRTRSAAASSTETFRFRSAVHEVMLFGVPAHVPQCDVLRIASRVGGVENLSLLPKYCDESYNGYRIIFYSRRDAVAAVKALHRQTVWGGERKLHCRSSPRPPPGLKRAAVMAPSKCVGQLNALLPFQWSSTVTQLQARSKRRVWAPSSDAPCSADALGLFVMNQTSLPPLPPDIFDCVPVPLTREARAIAASVQSALGEAWQPTHDVDAAYEQLLDEYDMHSAGGRRTRFLDNSVATNGSNEASDCSGDAGAGSNSSSISSGSTWLCNSVGAKDATRFRGMPPAACASGTVPRVATRPPRIRPLLKPDTRGRMCSHAMCTLTVRNPDGSTMCTVGAGGCTCGPPGARAASAVAAAAFATADLGDVCTATGTNSSIAIPTGTGESHAEGGDGYADARAILSWEEPLSTLSHAWDALQPCSLPVPGALAEFDAIMLKFGMPSCSAHAPAPEGGAALMAGYAWPAPAALSNSLATYWVQLTHGGEEDNLRLSQAEAIVADIVNNDAQSSERVYASEDVLAGLHLRRPVSDALQAACRHIVVCTDAT